MPTAGTVDLTVVVPAYNEEHRLPRTLDAICRYLRSSPGRHADWELIVVDDGSTDATAAAVREAAAAEPRIRLVGSPPDPGLPASPARNHGKGHAVRLGVLASRGGRVLVTDADLATPIEEVAFLHDQLDAGHAAAIGSRAQAGAQVEVCQHPLRKLLGRVGNGVIRAVAVPGVRDTQCGFKLFDGDRARAVFGRSRVDGWGIDVEILRMFHEAKWPVAEVPVRWAHQAGSKVRALDYAGVLLEQNAFFGWPLVALTVVVVVWLWRDPRARGLATVAFGAVLLSLGRTIPVPGTDVTLPGPWRLLHDLPLFESVIASRMAIAAVPALGVLLALACDRWDAQARPAGSTGRVAADDRALRAVGWAAVTAALLPIVPTPLATVDRAAVPSFIADGTWRASVPQGRTLVPVPLPDPAHTEALHWQTIAGLGFPLPGGYFNGPYGPDRTGIYGPVPRATSALLSEVSRTGRIPDIGPAQRREARKDLRFWRAGAVVLVSQPGDQALRLTVQRLMGAPGRWIGGVWVWQVHGDTGAGSTAA